jgi:exopolysaccharide biosynthesis polyprenyl glycosylphosphotransferase
MVNTTGHRYAESRHGDTRLRPPRKSARSKLPSRYQLRPARLGTDVRRTERWMRRKGFASYFKGGQGQTLVTATVTPAVTVRTRWEGPYRFRLLVTDVGIVAGAVLLAQYVRFDQPPLPHSGTSYLLSVYSILFAVLWLVALAIAGARSSRVIGDGIDEYRAVVSASFGTFGAIAITSLLFKLGTSREYLAIALPIGTAGLLVGRHFWRKQISRERSRGGCQTFVLAIGDRRAVSVLAREMTRKPNNGYRIVGVGIPGYGQPRGETILVNGEEIPILGDEAHALAGINECGADTVAVTGTEHFGVDGIRKLLWHLESLDVDLVVSPGVIDVAGQRLIMRPVSDYPLIHVVKPQYQGAKRFQKRAFDFCFAVAALVAAAPILLVAAIAIRLTSRGPIFYAAERIGLDGQPFTMLKLRTMVLDADSQLEKLADQNESEGAVLFKIRNDPRITPVGKILRRHSLDELPQFMNVLKQEMSVVGPRPPLRREVDTYDGDVKRRLLVRPGITGLWQVSGRSDLSWEESVRLDLSYVENWSMVTDLVIILKTLRAFLLHEGAY